MRLNTFRFATVAAIATGILCASTAAHAQGTTQCSDGIDNDGNGLVDALVETTANVPTTITVGDQGNGYGSEWVVREAVNTKIRERKLNIPLLSNSGALVMSDGSWAGGALHLPTLQKTCEILGYLKYESSTCKINANGGRCNYHSPGDDLMYRWNGTSFAAEPANPKYGKAWIAKITCSDPILGECHDGKDNDGDGRTDYPADSGCTSAGDQSERPNDPGCTSPSDPYEGFECADGIDNDNDGAIDLADFSCSSATDTDETNPKSQCQDGIDNDSDGLVDMNDPGCTSKQGNNEGAATAQCRDGVDNDGDGATDFPADFSCATATDLDETNPKSQCQDGIDNDNDGATDLDDFSCQSNKQKNDEANPKAGCQDVVDNDNDGLVDLADPGCSNGQDNNEGDEISRLSVSVECVMDNSDGSKVAYFSYNNATAGTLQVPVGSGGTPRATNIFTGVAQNQGQPTSFMPGIQRGVIGVVFASEATWSVRAPNSAASQATASAATPKCGKIAPQFDCQGYNQGVLEVKGGYSNPNSFPVQLPYGSLNSFSPSPVNRGQPTVFLPGLNPGAFVVQKGATESSLLWDLNGLKAQMSQSLAVCAGQCVDTAVGTIRTELDDIAIALAKVTKDAADVLASAAEDSSDQKATSSRARRRRGAIANERSAVDAQRAKAKADQYAADAKALTIQFPDVVKNCPDAPAYCSTVDRSATIEELRGLYASMRNHAQRVIARAYFRQTGSTNRKDAMVKRAKDLERRGLESLAELPGTETVCR